MKLDINHFFNVIVGGKLSREFKINVIHKKKY